jgi:DNA-directed RNA polymerase specialized sigma24 family protein
MTRPYRTAEPRPLTNLERAWVLEHLEIAVTAARRAFKYHHWDDPGLDYEDVTSSAYYGLSRAPLELGFLANPEPYAFMSCRQQIWNDRRAFANRTRGNATISYEDDLVKSSPDQGPDAIAIRLDDARRLRRGMRLLDDSQSEAVGWQLEGLTVVDMAKKAGVTERVMRLRLKKGLSAMAFWMTVRE